MHEVERSVPVQDREFKPFTSRLLLWLFTTVGGWSLPRLTNTLSIKEIKVDTDIFDLGDED
ncbi:hypothetical protein SK128_017385 [Halocaridina rubra]|uniref:Uncharacterized protein n=1 Tax=Halocaridina rubra TaxID=373956 RepID=A0AAN8XTT9_HALRR